MVGLVVTGIGIGASILVGGAIASAAKRNPKGTFGQIDDGLKDMGSDVKKIKDTTDKFTKLLK